MKEIVQLENKVLREKAEAIPLDEIKSKKIEEIIESMKLTLANESDGVGLAAPQIGISLRLFVVAPSVFTREDKTGPLVYINPKITRVSSEKPTLEEGCLSVRNQFGKIKRSEKVTIVAYDESGKKFTRGATGLLAEIYQHEVDHLDGILFVDNAWDIHEVLPTPQPKIVFFGTPTFAINVLEELELARITPALIVTAPDKRAGRGQEITPPPVKLWAEKRSIPIVQFDSLSADEAINILGANKPDLFIVAAYGKIIPKSILDIPTHGTLNVHPSLLPKYRGASPVQSTILAGDKTTGVSIMLLDEKLDHGPIVASEEYDITEESLTAEKLEEDLAHAGGELLAQIIPEWIAGKIKTREQDHEKATSTKKFTTEDGRIQPEKIGTPEAERIIQALSQNPGTFSEIMGKNGKLIRLKLLPNDIVIPAGKKRMSLADFKKNYL